MRQVADKWLEDARAGLVRNRSGDVYKPAAIRVYEKALRLYMLPALGARKFASPGWADRYCPRYWRTGQFAAA